VTRILAGQAGGRRLAVPPSGTRPTSDRAREALFSSLDSSLHGLAGVRFLDLYAGSGAVGLEAWSRGAARVVLVESAAVAVKVLRTNVTNLRSSHAPGPVGKIDVVAAKAERTAADLPTSAFDVVFADPPYDLATQQVAGVLATLAQRGVPRPGAIVVVERATRDKWGWPLGYATTHSRKYGDATLHYATFDPTLL
jgi:16S rRNA (guanine966-N2)-methyltransferase